MRTPPATPSDPPGTTRPIQSIERAAAVLEVVARAGGAASLKDVAAHTGLGKTTAHNILKTLTHFGWLKFSSRLKTYELAPGILTIASSLHGAPVLDRIRAELQQLVLRIGIPAVLAQPMASELGIHPVSLEVVMTDVLAGRSRDSAMQVMRGSVHR